MLTYIKEHYLYLIIPSKYEGADFLRMTACLSVLAFHCISTTSLIRVGWIGVDLFFVLSGFLIGGAIIDEYIRTGTFRYLRFYKNRFLRIHPVYLTGTIITIIITVIDKVDFNLYEVLKQLLINALFLQSYIIPWFIGANVWDPSYSVGGSWTLVIEWIFYLICPLVLVSILEITKNNLKHTFWIMIIIFLSGFFVRLYLTRDLLPDDFNYYFAYSIRPDCRYDELVAGILGALIIRIYPLTSNIKIRFLILGLILLSIFIGYLICHPTLMMRPNMMTNQILYFPTYLSLAFLFVLLSIYNVRFNSKLVNALARLSYPIYLIHMSVKLFVVTFQLPELLMLIIVANFSIIASYFISLLIEYPALQLYKTKPNSINGR